MLAFSATEKTNQIVMVLKRKARIDTPATLYKITVFFANLDAVLIGRVTVVKFVIFQCF